MSDDTNSGEGGVGEGGVGEGGVGEGTVSLDEVSCQLRSYGRWLEERSDVELAADDVDLLHDLDGGGFGIARRPRLLAGVAAIAALVVVVVAGLGLSGRAGSDEQLEAGPAGLGGVTPIEETADTPTSETGTADRPAVGTDDRSNADQVPTADDAASGGDGSADGTAAPQSGDSAGTASADDDDAQADQPASGEGADSDEDTTPDIAMTPSTVELDDEGKPPWDPAKPEVAGAPNFVSPTSGAVLDLNVMNTLRAQPVAGATVYVFEGWQNGDSVMSTSGDEPILLLPSRLITTGVMGQVQPGPLQLTVTAQDSAGNVLGTSRVDVTVAGSGGGASGRDVVGENPFPSN